MMPKSILASPNNQVTVSAEVLESLTYITDDQEENIQTNMASGYWKLLHEGKRVVVAKF